MGPGGSLYSQDLFSHYKSYFQSSNYPPSIHGKRSRSVSVVSSLMKGADSDASGVRRRRKSSKMDDRTALHDALVNSPYHKVWRKELNFTYFIQYLF